MLRTQPATLDEALNAAKAEEAAQGVDIRVAPDMDLDMLVDKLSRKLSCSTAAGVNAVSSAKTRCQLCNAEGHVATACSQFTYEVRRPVMPAYPPFYQYGRPPVSLACFWQSMTYM